MATGVPDWADAIFVRPAERTPTAARKARVERSTGAPHRLLDWLLNASQVWSEAMEKWSAGSPRALEPALWVVTQFENCSSPSSSSACGLSHLGSRPCGASLFFAFPEGAPCATIRDLSQ